MKIQAMKDIRDSRKDVIGFLHISDLQKIEALAGFNAGEMSHWTICDKVLAAYDAEQINNATASEIFEILRDNNTEIRTEMYRYDEFTHDLYRFNASLNCYVWIDKISAREFNTRYQNEYFD